MNSNNFCYLGITVMSMALGSLRGMGGPSIALGDVPDAEFWKLVQEGKIEGAKEVDLIPLHHAATHNDLKLAQILLDNGAEVNVKNKDNYTPLHRAVYANHVEMARFLIQKDADIDSKDNTGQTPLQWAADYNRIEIAQLLIDSGADMINSTKEGWTILHTSRKRNHSEISSFLLLSGAYSDGKSCYMDVEKVKEKLIAHDYKNINAQDRLGATRLMYGVITGNSQWVEFLLEHGADPIITMSNGKSVFNLIQNILDRGKLSSERQEAYQYIFALCGMQAYQLYLAPMQGAVKKNKELSHYHEAIFHKNILSNLLPFILGISVISPQKIVTPAFVAKKLAELRKIFQ